uniref:Uncharacterized protein n=1 Tax=Ditylenchus dipsaci TaxID=166011 RepID=A0A915CT36_9BILA
MVRASKRRASRQLKKELKFEEVQNEQESIKEIDSFLLDRRFSTTSVDVDMKEFYSNELSCWSESSSANTALSPECLALKLDQFCEKLAHSHKKDYCDFAGVEIEDSIDTLGRLRDLREVMNERLSIFDKDGKTDVNFDGAAIAGAKVVVDEGPATRSITRKLADGTGIEEFDLLYKGIPYEGNEIFVAKEIHEQRTDSIVESFVDFQKQLQFKLQVLNHAKRKVEITGNSKSAVNHDRLSKRNAVLKEKGVKTKAAMNLAKTPKKKGRIDPLGFTKIIDHYALEVASGIVDRTRKSNGRGSDRNLAPIPFNLDIFDDVENSAPNAT